MRAMGVDYVMVVFGGHAAFDSDDLNKLVWMCRIADEQFPTTPSREQALLPHGELVSCGQEGRAPKEVANRNG
jgi:hypothetical protein